jgi:selenocysteine-specific elongation factor
VVASEHVTSEKRRRAIFATAGHVDHGKTALIRALTGTHTDRLPEEKRRGISIELGFAELPGEPLSFIDVPGHRKLVHAMIAGVGGVDGLLLCVAADDGVMPQTREHLVAASLLGIRRVIVALTKSDLVDRETLELAEADARAALESLDLDVAEVVPTSAVTGSGVDALKRALLRFSHDLPPPPPTAVGWLSVDRVFSMKGAGTIVTGTLTRGRLEVGQNVWVVGQAGTRESSCRSLEVHGRSVAVADAPTRVAINLARLEADAVRRGDVVSTDSGSSTTRRMDVALRVVPGFEEELTDGSAVVVHVGTDRSSAKVHFIGSGLAQLVLDSELACRGGLGFVLRGFSADPRHGAVIGGGRVLDSDADPLPPRRNSTRRDARARALAVMAERPGADAARALYELAAPRALASRDVERRLGLEPNAVAAWIAQGKMPGILALGDGTSSVFEPALAGLGARALEVVEGHHRAAPHDSGMSLETLRAALGDRTSREAADVVVARAVASGALVMIGQSLVATPAFVEARRGETAVEARRILDALEAAGLSGLSETDVVKRSNLSTEAARSALARLSADGAARRLGDLWFSERALDALRRRVAEHFRTGSDMSISAFKDLAGVGRKQAIPLLEQLDREGTTRRVGDTRIAGARAAKE